MPATEVAVRSKCHRFRAHAVEDGELRARVGLDRSKVGLLLALNQESGRRSRLAV